MLYDNQVTTYSYDSHAQFTTILNSPKTYGFKDGTSYGSGADLFWGWVFSFFPSLPSLQAVAYYLPSNFFVT